MIAFAGLVVSDAVLVVQFGAGQYSPRLVHVFRRDAVIKNAIGLFVAPGVYALVATGDIGGSTHDGPETLTVVVALLLMVVALAAPFPFSETAWCGSRDGRTPAGMCSRSTPGRSWNQAVRISATSRQSPSARGAPRLTNRVRYRWLAGGPRWRDHDGSLSE